MGNACPAVAVTMLSCLTDWEEVQIAQALMSQGWLVTEAKWFALQPHLLLLVAFKLAPNRHTPSPMSRDYRVWAERWLHPLMSRLETESCNCIRNTGSAFELEKSS
jgi:hypothetical protein